MLGKLITYKLFTLKTLLYNIYLDLHYQYFDGGLNAENGMDLGVSSYILCYAGSSNHSEFAVEPDRAR